MTYELDDDAGEYPAQRVECIHNRLATKFGRDAIQVWHEGDTVYATVTREHDLRNPKLKLEVCPLCQGFKLEEEDRKSYAKRIHIGSDDCRWANGSTTPHISADDLCSEGRIP